jgi:iron complex transport system ATP-binding protein
MAAEMLRADRLTVALGGRDILHDLSVEIPRGGLVGILGPNGSGKTTLLRTIAGLIAPRSGRVLLNGQPLASFSRRALAQRLAVVPQETHLALDYSVLEVVLMGRYAHLGAFAFEGAHDLDAAHAALRATGVASFAERAIKSLSGGEKQRVIIASALAQLDGASPNDRSSAARWLLLDEPTASLDLHYQLALADLLMDLRQRGSMTLLLSTHDLSFAQRVCDHVVLLSAGRVLAEGAPRQVLTAEATAALYRITPDQARAFIASPMRDDAGGAETRA